MNSVWLALTYQDVLLAVVEYASKKDNWRDGKVEAFWNPEFLEEGSPIKVSGMPVVALQFVPNNPPPGEELA